jgi:hypothetical protein
MKVLSLRQPWASMVVHAGKRIENRKWKTNFRGEFLIHASKTMTQMEYTNAVRWALERGLIEDAEDVAHHLVFGGIIGRAQLVDVVPPDGFGVSDPPFCRVPKGLEGWHMHDQYGFVLEDIRPLPFTPCKGSLNFFRAPETVLAQLGLRAQIVGP